jgi:two-component system, chemotaxis family, CheB/CheR fusion protein
MKKILILEDYKDYWEYFQKSLDKHDKYSLKFVENGEEGVKALVEDHNFDLIITDIGMPIMDGYSFLSLRSETSIEKIKNIPVIIQTSYTPNLVFPKLKTTYGVVGFLRKPWDQEKLNSLLDDIFVNDNIENMEQKINSEISRYSRY